MIAESSQRLESLFASALEMKPEDRAAFLDAECANDSALRAERSALRFNTLTRIWSFTATSSRAIF